MKKIIFLLLAVFSFQGIAQRTQPASKFQDYVDIIGDDAELRINGVPFTGGSSTYNGASPTTIEVGGMEVGTVISDSTFSWILQAILAPYVAPTFSSFSMSGQSTTVEVGSSVSGVKTFTWAFNESGNVAANSMAIYDVTSARYLDSAISITSPGTGDVGTITYTTATSNSFRGEAVNTQGTRFYSSNFTISWRFYRYVGFSVADSAADSTIQAFSKEFDTNRQDASADYTNSTGGSAYFVIAYPASWGTAVIKKDGFVAGNFTLLTRDFVNASGHTESYNIYTSNDPTAGNYTGISIE